MREIFLLGCCCANRCGTNAAVSCDMLATAGITVETDMKLMGKLGYEVKLGNE